MNSGRTMMFTSSIIVLTCLLPITALLAQQASAIVGNCVYDEANSQTICSYSVISGKPALGYFILPVPENCQEHLAIRSERLSFEHPALHSEHTCGSVYGIKSEQELVEGQVEEFQLVYEGIFDIETAVIFANPRGSSECLLFPIPAIIECPLIPSVDWSIDATSNNFQIRKPTVTSAKLATMKIKSNVPVSISFNSFDNLRSSESSGSESVSTEYAITPSEQKTPPSKFYNAKEFNTQGLTVEGNRQEHGFSIWSRIAVETKTKASNYQNVATVTLTVENSDTFNDGM